MSKKVAIGVGAVSLLLGIGIGAAGESPPPSSPSAKPAETVTETVTPKPEVKVKEVTPAACADALDSAESVAGAAGEFADIASEYLPLIPRAYDAGWQGDEAEAQAVIDRVTELNGQVEDLNGRLDRLVSGYVVSAEECRS